MTQTMTAEGVTWRLELEPEEVKARLRWGRRRGHPKYLWPDVRPESWRAGVARLSEVARSVLSGRPAALRADEAAGARALGVAGFTSGLGPLVGCWIERGAVQAIDPVRSLFLLHLAHGRERAERQRIALERAVSALAGVGVTPVVLKSCHTGRVYFPEPGTRPGLDIDLGVPAEDLERAESALAGAGYERAALQHAPRKSDWLPPGVERWPRSLELLHSGSQYAVDLHGSLDRNFFGVRWVRPGTLASAARPWPGAGAPVRVLGQPELIGYHALHASEGLHNLTLIRLVELVLMVRRDAASGALEWAELLRLLRRSGGARFAYPAFALAERLVPGTMDPGFLRSMTDAATPRMRAVVADTTPAGAQRLDGLSLRERFMGCATPRDYARRLAHMLAPAPSGGSLRRLAGQYVERAYRLLAGRVTVGNGNAAGRPRGAGP